MTVMTIAAWQAPGNLADIDANRSAVATAAAAASKQGAQLLITPEMYLSGYNVPKAELMKQSGVDFVGIVARLAREHGIAIVAGVPEFTDEGCYNTSLMVSGTGDVLMQHRKYQLFGELDRNLFQAGLSAVTTAEYLGVTVGTMICYDVEFAESVRQARRLGVDLLVVPTAQMEGFDIVNDAVIRARAWDNGMYVAYVNRVGSEFDLTYIGQSSICTPSGQRAAGLASRTKEELLIAKIDTAEVISARQRNPYLEDLRVG